MRKAIILITIGLLGFAAGTSVPRLAASEAVSGQGRQKVDEATMMKKIAGATSALIEHNILQHIAFDNESRELVRNRRMGVPEELLQAKALMDAVISGLSGVAAEDPRLNAWRDLLIENLSKVSSMDATNIQCREDAMRRVESAACSEKTAANAGAKGILVLTGYGRGELEFLQDKAPAQPVYVARDLADAAAWILADLQKG